MIIYLFVVIQIYKMFSGFLLFYSGYITPISGRAKIKAKKYGFSLVSLKESRTFAM